MRNIGDLVNAGRTILRDLLTGRIDAAEANGKLRAIGRLRDLMADEILADLPNMRREWQQAIEARYRYGPITENGHDREEVRQ